MEGKFANIFDLPDGNQVLIQKLFDPEEEKDIIILSTSLDGCHVELKMGYNNLNSRDACFDEFDQEKAEVWREKINKQFV